MGSIDIAPDPPRNHPLSGNAFPFGTSRAAPYIGTMDIQTRDPVTAAPPVIRREDYRPPDWAVPAIALDFDLGLTDTRVTAILSVERQGGHDRPLLLDGDGITAVRVLVDGQIANDWQMDGDRLVVPLAADSAEITIETRLDPSANSQLMGLYASNGMLCTQCEAQGFRRITFFPDRPDVLSRYRVRMAADKAAFPILLSNGDRTDAGDLPGGRHYAVWTDPFPKPSYLFAAVAGDLVANHDRFTTMSGREVALAIWVRANDESADGGRTRHAMQALKNSMAWDERVFGREYDLDIFNIVAVSDFNMGAMENKGLNIFNTRYILADPDTATDADFDAVEAVVAHEYFHNWSGNRVTCRDWFQLSLKEGFTVLRDQLFSADMGSPAVKRIDDVRVLRAAQFPEDAGPLAHPIRPDSYMEISNFYTATVYNKGAEVIRMMRTMAGEARFRAGTDLYFDRHDGQAATCDDFIAAMEEGAGLDLGQFRRWYEQPGTPRVTVRQSWEAETDSVRIMLSQVLGAEPSAMVIPLRMALIAADGSHGGEELLILDQPHIEIERSGFAARPVLSINRGFSAPITLDTDRTPQDLAFLSGHDDDPFARYEAMQALMADYLVAAISTGQPGDPAVIVDAVAAGLDDAALDEAFLAELVTLPTEAFLGEQMLVIDPDAIHGAREALKTALAAALADRWAARYQAASAPRSFSLAPADKAARRLAGVTLSYLAAADPADGAARALAQYRAADTMTLRLSALGTLTHLDVPERAAAFDDFHARWAADPLVIDKWFSWQALSLRADTLDRVEALAAHPDFTMANPNRVRALWGALSVNQLRFHDASGRGYRLLADVIARLDKANPQTAARFVPPLGRWQRFEPGRSAHMRAALEALRDSGPLSKDVSEQVLKSLG